ncbi:GNAT family N-acetyltransferase [Terriglobus roseus]|uniref:Tagatose 1,6-diphosphate aldolase n=1 Tax=Terriglobus roseus TaxID=392734 RepID=A0A1H4P7E1_9BACT|nr:GNAT family N-acetyltransferase [Terriglobus roseus]SEC03356.1 tagatose 1,6-diphosphate aldolase [Terriglobus roseus]
MNILLPPLQDEGGLRLEYLETASHKGLCVPTRFYLMKDAHGVAVGDINLRLHSTQQILLYGGHIGYTVYPQFRGEHYAARAVRLLIPGARGFGIDPLWITTDPENTASRRTCELAGAVYVETIQILYHQAIFPEGRPCKCRYRLSTAHESKAQKVPSEQP